jgi:hypothetical protein
MKSIRKQGVTVGLVILSGLLMVGYGIGITFADPPPSNPGNPFQAILDKLDQILAAITGSGGAGDHSGVTQNWDKVLPSGQRFVVLAAFGNAAVRDNDTGLVWEQSPSTTTETWFNARHTCATKNVGGRKGFRVPAVFEITSLIDPSAPVPPKLPVGHPFTNVMPVYYWAATTDSANPAFAWGADFLTGTSGSSVGITVKTTPNHVWCVRGEMNADQY